MSPGPEKQFDPTKALERAMGVFWARGFEAASLSELTAEMGIGRKSLYDTFGNKRELFLQSMDYYAQLQWSEISRILNRPVSPLSNLKMLLKRWESMCADPEGSGCFLGTNMADFETSDEEVCQKLEGYMAHLEGALMETLKKAQQLQEIRQDVNCRDTARMLLSINQGMALLSRVMSGHAFPKSVVTAVVDSLKPC